MDCLGAIQADAADVPVDVIALEQEKLPDVRVVADVADKICVMREGRIVGVGAHESLLESCGTYIDMVNAGAGDPGRLQLLAARPR